MCRTTGVFKEWYIATTYKSVPRQNKWWQNFCSIKPFCRSQKKSRITLLNKTFFFIFWRVYVCSLYSFKLNAMKSERNKRNVHVEIPKFVWGSNYIAFERRKNKPFHVCDSDIFFHLRIKQIFDAKWWYKRDKTPTILKWKLNINLCSSCLLHLCFFFEWKKIS